MKTRRQFLLLLSASMVAVVAAIVLYVFPPEASAFYPRCAFHTLTGLNCPGCGCLRATHQLLHGNLEAAFLLNPLYIFCLPMLIALAAQQIFRSVTGRPLFNFSLPNGAVWSLVVVIFIFTIVRNFPGLNF